MDGISAQKNNQFFSFGINFDFSQFQNKRNALIWCLNSYFFFQRIVTASKWAFKINDRGMDGHQAAHSTCASATFASANLSANILNGSMNRQQFD